MLFNVLLLQAGSGDAIMQASRSSSHGMAHAAKSTKSVAGGNSTRHSNSHGSHSDMHSIRHIGGCWLAGA